MESGSSGTTNRVKSAGVLFQLANGNIQSCNSDTEKILGYTIEEMSAVVPAKTPRPKVTGNFFPPNTHPAIAFANCKSVVTALKTGQPCSDVEMGFYRPDGNLIWLSLSSQPLFSSSNDELPMGVVTTFEDITAQKSDRRIEWQSDRPSSEAIDSIPGIFYIFDVVAHRHLYLNEQTYILLGYTPQEIVKLNSDFIQEQIHPEDLKLFPAHVQRLDRAKEGEICQLEYRMRHRNGEWRWFCSQDRVYKRTVDGEVGQILGIATDITERKQAQIALSLSKARLKEKERLLRLALENAKAGTWSWDIEQQQVFWSPENYALYGIEPQIEPLEYRDWERALHPEDLDRSNREVQKILAGESSEFRTEFRIVHPQQGVRWLLGIGNITRNEDCKPIRLSGINLDISDFKKTESAFYHSQQQLRILLDNLPIFTGFLSTEGIVTEINQTALDSANLKPKDVLNQKFRDTFWWNYSTEIQTQIDKAIERAAAGETVRFDLVARVKDDKYIVMDFGIVPKFGDKGVEYLVPFAINVSDREVSRQALQRSERELELIAKLIPQQIWTAALDGRIDYINQRWRDYTGLDLKQMKLQGWASIVHPDDLPKVANAWIQAVKTGTKFNVETRLRSKERTYRWFLSQARPLRNESGRIIKWYGTNTSIDKIKELETKLLLQTQDLVEANRLKDEFLAIVSHELRTPLNPILGWSQLLANGKLDRERTAIGIKIIERNALLQARLIDDLLDVSQILRGTLHLNTMPLDLKTVVRSAIDTVRSAATDKSIQIESVFEPNIGRVLGDVRRLEQVVWNLLSNAIKFTPPGGKITVILKRAGTQVQLQVRDTGKGIEPQFLPFVFERFRQAQSSNTREFGGLGLGLAIVRHLTQLHGGTVAVESAGEGRGSAFSLKLPFMDNLETEQVNDSTARKSVLPNRFNGSKILVVDDERDSLEILTLVLQQEGATIISATSAEAALKAFSHKTPDLIISDIGMPGMDGLTLMTQIRQLPQGKNVPAIALTAYAAEIDKQSSFAAGFQKHLAKPISIPELITAITELI